jgi:acyl carrier protein
VREQVRQFIISSFMFGMEDVELSDDDSFVQKGLIDSTGVLELVAFVEAQYSISIRDDELVPENLDSINGLLRFLDKKLVPTA